MKPNKIDLKVGYLCNDNCIHCAIAHARRDLKAKQIETELTTEQVKAQIDLYHDKQYDTIILTGGEITIRKDFLEIVQYASQRFKAVDIQTNGRKLATDANLEVLSKLDNVHYIVAIHGPNSDVHDSITRKKHSFEQTTNSIKKMVALPNHPSVLAKFVLSNLNKQYICQTVRLASELGCEKINIAYMHGCTDDYQLLDQLLPSYKEITPIVDQAFDLGDQLGIYVTVETFPLCTVKPSRYDRVDDLLLPTFELTVQPVNEKDYQWNSVRVDSNKLKQQQCLSCGFQLNCEGPWEEYWDVRKGEGLNPPINNGHIIPIVPDRHASRLSGYARLFGAK